MPITRRELLRTAAGAGALLLARPGLALGAAAAQAPGFAADRRSRLFPDDGLQVVHADLHNHTLLSDGAGRAEEAFAQMRAAGLDVAALTDHAVMAKNAGEVTCRSGPCTAFMGINEESWQTLTRLADDSLDEGTFVAMRGFEWTTANLGHVNVWFTEQWTDAFTMGALTEPRNAGDISRLSPAFSEELQAQLLPLFDDLPAIVGLDLFYEWLGAPPDRAVLGGGSDGLAGFNHPREYGDFEAFAFVSSVVERMVSCEVLNMGQDYLFRSVDEGKRSPIGECLDAGWRVGLLGVSDEHGETYGALDTGRAGLWVSALTRDGVREAMASRRFFATYEPGLRLDAAANGVRMGGVVPFRAGRVELAVDLDSGPSWYGRQLLVQVLRSGDPMPTIVDTVELRVPTPDEPVLRFAVDANVDDGRWLLLRITDPGQPADPRATGDFAGAGRAVAYASPFFLDPDAPGAVAPAAAAQPAPAAAGAGAGAPELPATGGSSAFGGTAAAAGAATAAGLAAWWAARRAQEP